MCCFSTIPINNAITAALAITSGGRAGVEETSATVTTVFLNGTRIVATRGNHGRVVLRTDPDPIS